MGSWESGVGEEEFFFLHCELVLMVLNLKIGSGESGVGEKKNFHSFFVSFQSGCLTNTELHSKR
ncbi:MAG TPA: hypothetical protein DCE56_04070 [Cyanobacteria bacterium UBA8553]|nr:hypothetical protein [Cyanobacteria bacterium UBA8553]